MCGIVTVIGKRGRNVSKDVIEAYEAQKTRGQEGFGFVAIKDGQLIKVDRSLTDTKIKKDLKYTDAEIILFHHRKPTSTGNIIRSTHPFFVSHEELEYDWYLAHNGVVKNTDFLKTDLNKLGYVYHTEFKKVDAIEYLDGKRYESEESKTKHNDSETLAIEFARWMEGLQDEIKSVGGIALWAVALEKGTDRVLSLHWGHNYGRPLTHRKNKKRVIIASEGGEDIKEMELHSLSMEDYLSSRKPQTTTYELKIDDAMPAPVTRVYGYHNSYSESSTKKDLPEPEYCLYTRDDAEALGYSLVNFTYVCHDDRSGVSMSYYLPDKYRTSTSMDNRQFLPTYQELLEYDISQASLIDYSDTDSEGVPNPDSNLYLDAMQDIQHRARLEALQARANDWLYKERISLPVALAIEDYAVNELAEIDDELLSHNLNTNWVDDVYMKFDDEAQNKCTYKGVLYYIDNMIKALGEEEAVKRFDFSKVALE